MKDAYLQKGIGSALLTQAEAWAKKHKVEQLECFITTNNEAAIALFESASFEQNGTRKNALKFDDYYLDELYYSKLF